MNLEQLLDKDFVNLGVRYASLAHLNPDQIGNILARATGTALALKYDSSFTNNNTNTTTSNYYIDQNMSGGGGGAGSRSEDRKRSLWIPDDAACPCMWFVASIDQCQGVFPPPSEAQIGPLLVSTLMERVESGDIQPNECFVAPSVIEDYDVDITNTNNTSNADGADDIDLDIPSVKVDSGRWRPLKEYFQLRMQILSPGRAIYSPAGVASKGLPYLSSL